MKDYFNYYKNLQISDMLIISKDSLMILEYFSSFLKNSNISKEEKKRFIYNILFKDETFDKVIFEEAKHEDSYNRMSMTVTEISNKIHGILDNNEIINLFEKVIENKTVSEKQHNQNDERRRIILEKEFKEKENNIFRLYDILELQFNATHYEIIRQYHSLLVKYEISEFKKEAAFRIKQIYSAYVILSEIETRRIYDNLQTSKLIEKLNSQCVSLQEIEEGKRKIKAKEEELINKEISLILSSSNPYNILGVNENSKFEEIKKAYHNLNKKFHPDKFTDKEKAREIIRIINDAYEELKIQYINKNRKK